MLVLTVSDIPFYGVALFLMTIAGVLPTISAK